MIGVYRFVFQMDLLTYCDANSLPPMLLLKLSLSSFLRVLGMGVWLLPPVLSVGLGLLG